MRYLPLAALLIIDLVALALIGAVVDGLVFDEYYKCDILCQAVSVAPFLLLAGAGYATWREVRRIRRA